MSADVQTTEPKRGRGRPPKAHDNRRVQEYLKGCGLRDWDKHFTLLNKHIPWLADIIEAAACAQLDTQDSDKPLKGRRIFSVLMNCAIVGAQTIPRSAPWVDQNIPRYALASEVASLHIARYLDTCPKANTPNYREALGEYFSP